MKLARVEHVRCGQPAGKWGISTYVWVPDTMTADELQQHVDTAIKTYLEAEDEFKRTAALQPPGYGPTIQPGMPDNMTVGELRANYEAAAFAYKEYQKQLDLSRKGFAWHLKQASGSAILQFWDHKLDTTAEADWGHRHGTHVEYDETIINDFPEPQGEDKEEDYV